MRNLRAIFPFMTTSNIPENIQECLSDYAFRELTDTLHISKGFGLLTQSDHFIHADNRWLFKYVENKRANKHAVTRLHKQRLQKATDKGREITSELTEEMWQQAEREVLKTAPIRETIVYLIFDENVGRIWCGGSSAGQCQKALKHLRSAIGSLKTTPLIYDLASRLLARQLCKGFKYAEGFPNNLIIPANGKVQATDGDQRVTFDGVDLRDEGVGKVLSDMMVRAVEMQLVRPVEKGDPTVVATFTLNVPESGPVHLKGLDYAGAAASNEGDEAHHYATEMLILGGFAWEIFDTLRVYFHGSTGTTRTEWAE
ncbi:recombination-associated protein RdgC [Pantoea stewartii]|uniref:recombination-associated protein RdgC n=1 Tax=Pantoea stewartii TaxID=66269 RepID=UPI003704184B